MDVQTSLRMSKELRDRLAQAAEDNGRAIGEEIRRRLEASFGPAPSTSDPKTAALLNRIDDMVGSAGLMNDLPWHEDPLANAVLRAALPMLVPVVLGEPKAIEGRIGWAIYGKPDGSFPEPAEIARGWVAAIFAAEREKGQKP